jgi:nicotinic acid mononucleotide adenylyltransferase
LISRSLPINIPNWYGGDELARTIPFIVVGRPGGQTGGTPPPVVMPAVSSSAVRAALAAGKPVDGLVPRAVLDYILRKGLYKALA